MLNRFGPQKKGSLRNPDICTVLNSDPAYLHSYSIRKSSDYCLSRLDGALTEKIKLFLRNFHFVSWNQMAHRRFKTPEQEPNGILTVLPP